MPTATRKKPTAEKPEQETPQPDTELTAHEMEWDEGEYVLMALAFDQVTNEKERARGRRLGRTIEPQFKHYRKGDIVPLYRGQVDRLVGNGSFMPLEHVEAANELEKEMAKLDERKAKLTAELEAKKTEAQRKLAAKIEAERQARTERAEQANRSVPLAADIASE